MSGLGRRRLGRPACKRVLSLSAEVELLWRSVWGDNQRAMTEVLILFAHPALEKSRAHRQLLKAVADLPQVYVQDLYERYPEFDIDVAREQVLLSRSDVIVLMHPFHWYSMPALLKQWMDLVLQLGFAYGPEGVALRGKRLLCAITTGGSEAAYQLEGHHGTTVYELLAPVRQTARLCGMDFVDPYVVYGAPRLSEAELVKVAQAYAERIVGLQLESPSSLQGELH